MTAELVAITSDPAALEAANPGAMAVMVTSALAESKSWLNVAMTGTDPTPIAEFKQWAMVVEEATKQKQLGRDIELDAAEMVRRAERGIGIAIRNGQDAGEIATREDGLSLGSATASGHQTLMTGKISPAQFFGSDDHRSASYALADNVTNEQFDAAIEEAKSEKNLSRANVVRKVRSETPQSTDRHELFRKTRRLDGNRIIESTVRAAEPSTPLLEQIDYAALDADRIGEWISSLSESIKTLRSLQRNLEKELNRVSD